MKNSLKNAGHVSPMLLKPSKRENNLENCRKVWLRKQPRSRTFVEYWNHYRPHEGLGGNMVMPYPQDADGEIQEISFLGGLLRGYRRVKQAA